MSMKIGISRLPPETLLRRKMKVSKFWKRCRNKLIRKGWNPKQFHWWM